MVSATCGRQDHPGVGHRRLVDEGHGWITVAPCPTHPRVSSPNVADQLSSQRTFFHEAASQALFFRIQWLGNP